MKPPLVLGLIATILMSSPVAFADKYDDAIKSHQDEINRLPATQETTIQNEWNTNTGKPYKDSGGSIPSGMIAAFNLGSCPSGWAEFRVPGRALVGEGSLNDGTLNHYYALGQAGGEQRHRLSIHEMPSHRHGDGWNVPASPGGGGGRDGGQRLSGYAPSTYAGGNGFHENRMPYYVVKFCRKN